MSNNTSTAHKRAHPLSDFLDPNDAETPMAKRVRWTHSDDHESTNEDGQEETADSITADERKVYFAATCHSGRFGCAYYDPVKCVIYVLEDTQETAQLSLTHMCLEQAKPDVILTSWKADDMFIDTLRTYSDSANCTFHVRLAKEFVATRGRDRLLSLGLFTTPDQVLPPSSESSGEPEARNAYDFMQKRRSIIGRDPTMGRWQSTIRLGSYTASEGSHLCMASVGALLDHMVRERAVGELQDEGVGGLNVRAIEVLTLDKSMHINSDALHSLQVFENERHASVHSDKTKEGLSLFGILNSTQTRLGYLLLRSWMLRPSLDIQEIRGRHDAVSCFLRSENGSAVDVIFGHLQGIKNVPRYLGRMQAGKAKLSEWQGIVKFTFHTAMLYDTLAELNQAGRLPIMRKLHAALDIAVFKQVGVAINETIDWEESVHAARVCVRPHVDDNLDKMKHIYHGIDDVLSKVAEQMWDVIPEDYVPSLNVVYFPQLGFLVSVPMQEQWMTDEGIQVLDGWTFQFSSDAQVYFKSPQMHDLDRHIGDLHSSIVDREIEIVQELLEKVQVHSDTIAVACDACAELDCLLSFARASRVYNYERPIMVEENVIEIAGGRHPLQERIVDTFVPNDLMLAGGIPSQAHVIKDVDVDSDLASTRSQVGARPILVCTGANACGKSIYLKQAALIVIMAQIGCFVPASRATLGITDKIFTRVQTRESVSKTQSSFMIDLNQVSLALRNCTKRSLVLLDEFGKGTISSGSYSRFDGAGLFCGVIKHLLARGPDCPKVLATTHFHEIFHADMLDPRSPSIAFVHMQIMLTNAASEVNIHGSDVARTESETEEDDRQFTQAHGEQGITYLYRVAGGLARNSHAAQCAALSGVPRAVVRRAQYVSRLMARHELGGLLDEEMKEGERRDLESAEGVCRRFLAIDLDSEEGRALVVERGTKEMLAQVLGREELQEDEDDV